jgi:peroxiredoxin-like protein
MHDLPHRYRVAAAAEPDGDIGLSGENLPRLPSAPPAEFGGPGDRWSPETLLVAAIAGCFVLTFRAIARASKLAWRSLSCDVEGTLDRVERVTRFTRFEIRASLDVPAETSEERARRLLEKAEEACLITSSLSAPVHLTIDVASGGAGSSPTKGEVGK